MSAISPKVKPYLLSVFLTRHGDSNNSECGAVCYLYESFGVLLAVFPVSKAFLKEIYIG